jgi:glycerol-3-phosphate acyltransferase PlsY
VGIWEGVVTGIVDIGKGAAAVLVARAMGADQFWVLGAGFAAIFGHNFPLYIGLRGGKGVATVIGVVLAISPLTMAIVLPLIGIGWLVLRHMFTTILLVSPLFVAATWLVEESVPLTVFTVVVVLFIIYRSRARFDEVGMALSRVKANTGSGRDGK